MYIDTSDYVNTLNKAIGVYNQWEQHNQTLQKFREDYNEVSNIFDIAVKEEKRLKTSIELLERHYSSQKKAVVASLRDQINEVINVWYGNNYDLRFNTKSVRGVIKTELVDNKRYGTLEIVCGDAVKQTIGSLFSFTFVKSTGGDFIFLDEAYSNMGIEEINRLPDVLNDVDLQMFIIEHKCTLLDNSYATTIHVSRSLNSGSKITIEDPSNLLEYTYQRLNSNFIDEDKELLIKYGYIVEDSE